MNNNYKMNTYIFKPIVNSGYIDSYTGKYSVNYSSILSRLIQEAGRYCEEYASDLFIDWESVLLYIDGASCESESEKMFLFGFRKYGVDHDNFVFSRVENCEYLEYEYRSLWRLDVKTGRNEYGTQEITLTLGRVF